MPLEERIERKKRAKELKKTGKYIKNNYKTLRKMVLDLIPREEIESLAKETGFYIRKPKDIRAFEFVICCVLAAVVEGKRGFASVWRLLNAAAGIVVARSAVTQRFGNGSACLMKTLWERVTQRLEKATCPDMLKKLEEFKAVLAHDGSVLRLSPLLQKLFPATRTNHTQAAGKLHGIADVVNRRFVGVKFTGERDSELAVARSVPIEENVIYLVDLGYTSYDFFADIKDGGGHLDSRLKSNANPKIVAVRHGVWAPVRTVRQGLGLNHPELRFTKCHDTFDLDARFNTKKNSVILRVVGVYNPELKAYHIYVTTLPPEKFSPKDIAELYRLRWVIELLFKLLKSSCHLDHLDTSNPDAIRTHIYASLLASTILSALCQAAASSHDIHPSLISPLMAGIAAPIIVMPLLLLWLERQLTPEALADSIFRVLAIGCRDQNPKRTERMHALSGKK
jgi:IS4 transposase